jgi:hypothetical protein
MAEACDRFVNVPHADSDASTRLTCRARIQAAKQGRAGDDFKPATAHGYRAAADLGPILKQLREAGVAGRRRRSCCVQFCTDAVQHLGAS